MKNKPEKLEKKVRSAFKKYFIFIVFVIYFFVFGFNIEQAYAAITYYDSSGTTQISFNNISQNTVTPTFRVASSIALNRFQLELNTASNFTGTAYTQTFSGTYTTGTQYNLTTSGLSPSLPMTNGVTYFVRVRTSNNGGSTYSAWTTATKTFTYKSSGNPTWFQATDEQFNTGTLNSASTTGSGSVQVVVGGNWYNSSWFYRESITVDNTKVGVNQTNFPVYVNLANLGSAFFTHATSGCGDIRITKADGVTELAREIVSCTNGSSTGEMYFKADSLLSSTSTKFYIYYGNSGAGDYTPSSTYGENNVWTNGYLGVWHYQENQAGTGNASVYTDSVAAGHSGTDYVAATDKTGILGLGQQFNGTSDYIQIPSFSFGGAITVSSWVNYTAYNNWSRLMDFGSGAPSNNIFVANNGTSQNMRFGIANGGTEIDLDVNNFWQAAGTWQYFTGTINAAGNMTAYLNGVSKGSNTNTTVVPSVSRTNQYVGRSNWGGDSYFNGYQDELRISNVARSASWVSTEYNNQSSPATFYSVASEETINGSTGSIISPAINFNLVPSVATWGKASWSETETHGSVSMQVYYNAGSGCNTVIPDGALSGNSAGFATSPINLSGLNTTTYANICLKSTLTYSGGTPYLNDWTVSWATIPTITSYANTSNNTFDSTSCSYANCGARIGGGPGIRQWITITGTDFGADPGASNRSSATYNIKVGTHQITSTNVTAWSDTSITFTTDSNVTGDTDADWGTNFGGVGALTVTSNGLVSSGFDFYVFPQVTSITVPTAVANAAREYNAADTDGVITLNGTRLGTATTGGWVRILGCDSTTCSSPTGSATTTSWSNTAITVQVPTVIANNVYTGSVVVQQGTGTYNKVHTYTASGFMILPRINSLSPTSAGAGGAVTINGDHFCQNNATCPTAFDANNNVTFQSATDATIFTSWSDSAVVTAVPSAAITGTVLLTSNAYNSNNSSSFTVLSPIPSDPTSLNQFSDSALTSSLSVGSVSSSTSLYLTEIMQAALSGGTLYSQIEYDPVGTAFSCIGTGACAQAVEGTGKAGPGPIDCSVLANGCAIAITPSDGVYHWQARVRYNKGGVDYYSNWVSYGGNSESGTDFQIDRTGPVITFSGANTCATAVSSISTNGATIAWTVNESATGQLEYSKNSSLTSSVNTSLDSSAFTHSLTLSNLDSGTTYYFRAKSTDSVGNSTNRPISPPYCSFTTSSIAQPAKTTKFYIAGIEGTLGNYSYAETSTKFSVYVPENSVSVISAFVELTGFSSNWGTNNIGVSVNGQATSTYSFTSGSNNFKILYPVNSSNLNFDPIDNTFNVSTDLGLNIISSELILTYSYAP